MLKLSLSALDRSDEVRLQETIPPDHPMWEGLGAALSAPVEVDLTARDVGEGVLVRGRLRSRARLECRRCLTETERAIDQPVDLLFATLEEEDEDAGGEVYPLPARGSDLDLSGPVREQIVLHLPQYVLCREDCRGLCPQCGADLNAGPCDCAPEQAESPWDALKKLKLD